MVIFNNLDAHILEAEVVKLLILLTLVKLFQSQQKALPSSINHLTRFKIICSRFYDNC